MAATVVVSIVLYESAADIGACIAALRKQTRPPDRIVVLDNGSSDDGSARARRAAADVEVIELGANLGFAAAHNIALRRVPGDIHVVLNPDCRLGPDFISAAERALGDDGRVGSVAGRLLRFSTSDLDGDPAVEGPTDILDATGMVGLRNRRVLDRGGGLPASGCYLEPSLVFGATGAAAVYRRAMLEDVAFGGEYFDERFFAYREDVDLAWRAQLLGWSCRYEPTAVARHRRRVVPERRRSLPAWINRVSIANRWRMLLKNETATGWRRDGPAILARDAQILGFILAREWTSLPAIPSVARDVPRLLAQRRDLMSRRRANARDVTDWFGRTAERPLRPAET